MFGCGSIFCLKMAVSRELAKKELTDQWETYCDYKQDFVEALNNYAKYCSEMTPKLKVCGYLEKLVGKSPNQVNENEWKKEVGLAAYDCTSSRSSRASSRSSVQHLTRAKRRQIADQVPMAVDASYPYYAEMQPEAPKEVAPDDVKKSLGQILGKLDDLGGALQSLNSRVQDLENF